MVAAAASAALIGWDWVGAARRRRALRRRARACSRSPGRCSSSPCMGLLLKFTDFAAVLLLAAVITGLIWLCDAQCRAPAARRRSRRAHRRGHGARLLPGDRRGVPDPLVLGRAVQDPVGLDEAHAARGRLHPGEQVHLRHPPAGAEQEDRSTIEPGQARRRGGVPLPGRTRASTTSSAWWACPATRSSTAASASRSTARRCRCRPRASTPTRSSTSCACRTFAEKLGQASTR